MVQAFILIKIFPGKAREIYDHVSNLESVKETDVVYGEYDLILKVQTGLPEDLDNFVFSTLRQIEGVISTTTCLCASTFR